MSTQTWLFAKYAFFAIPIIDRIPMKTFSTVVLFTVLMSMNVAAQRSLPEADKDSLWAIWTNPQELDSNRLKALHIMSWRGYMFSQPDSAFYFAQLLYDYAEKKGLTKPMGTALNTQATALNFQGDYTTALEYYTRFRQICEELDDKRGLGAALNNMANIYKNQGDYSQALDLFFQSLRIREEIQDKMGLASSLGNIANIYMTQTEYVKAIDYLSRCLAIMKELENKQGVAGTLNNLGLIYADQGDYERALDHYNRSLHIREELGDRRGIAESMNNIGNIYRESGEFGKANEYHSQSLAIRETLKDKKGVASSLYNLGKVHAAQSDYLQAMDYGNRALPLAQEVGDVQVISDAAQLLYMSYKASKRHESALNMFELHIAMRDSIHKDENKREMMRQQFQYDFEKREALLKAEQEKKDAIALEELRRQRSERNLMGLGFLLVILVGGGTGMFLHQRRKAEFHLRSTNSELKALRAQMKPHFIFNALNSIHNFIDHNNTQTAKDYLVKFSKHMRNVLNNNLTEEVLLQDEIDALKEYLELEKANLNGKFQYNIEIDPELDPENTTLSPLMIQPFVENAIWHGIAPKESEGNILLRIAKDNDLLHITVTDDGVGRKHSAECKKEKGHKSIGIRLTTERMEILNRGRKSRTGITFTDLEPGLQVAIDLPFSEKF